MIDRISWGDKAYNPGVARDVRKGLIAFAEKNPGVMYKPEGGPKPWVPVEERESAE